MRRRGHIHERSPGSFEVRYSRGKDALTGRYLVGTTTVRGTRRDAERELTRRLRTVDTGEHVDPTRVTMQQWLVSWLSSITPEVSPKTHERYEEIVRCYLITAFGKFRLSSLTSAHIQAVYSAWAVADRRDGRAGSLSARTRRHMHRVLRSALARAVEHQLLARNPADAFKKRLPKIERSEIATLDVNQTALLLHGLSRSRVYWPVLIALSTGMRRGEVLALRWKNVDLDRRSVRVMESLEQTKAGIRFKAPKSEKTRVIALPEFAADELRRLKRIQAEELLHIGVAQTGETLLCCREDGAPKQPDSLTHEFTYQSSRIAGLPKVRFHDLRHTHATQLLLAGVHPKIAQERLGHSTITTTLDLYSHVTDSMQSEAAARLDAALRPAIRARPPRSVASSVA